MRTAISRNDSQTYSQTHTTWQRWEQFHKNSIFQSAQHTKYTLLTLFDTFECTSGQLDLIIFRDWIWTLMCWFTRVIMIVKAADLIKIISSYARVWPDWVYMIRYCQVNWWVYQASAGTGNKQHCLPLTKLLVVSLISPLFVKSETISRLPYLLHVSTTQPSQRNSWKPEPVNHNAA